MKCLNSVEMMELLYHEADPATLEKWRNHLLECPVCRNSYWQLDDTRQWLNKNDSADQPVVLLMAPPSKRQPTSALKIAAAAVLAVFLSVAAGLYVTRAQKETATLVARQQKVEQKLQNAALQFQDTNRNQYMMLLALKDYLDHNYQTKKVSYEQFR